MPRGKKNAKPLSPDEVKAMELRKKALSAKRQKLSDAVGAEKINLIAKELITLAPLTNTDAPVSKALMRRAIQLAVNYGAMLLTVEFE